MFKAAGAIAIVAIAALGASADAAVKTNGSVLVVKVKCKKEAATPGSPTQPPDSVYQGVYGAGSCSGNVKLTAGVAGGKKLKAGKGIFSIAPGTTANVNVKLTRKARAALFQIGRLRMKVALNSSAPATVAKTLTVRPLKPAK